MQGEGSGSSLVLVLINFINRPTNQKCSIDSKLTFSLTYRATVVARLKFDASDRFACMMHRWKAKNLLFPMVCCNINLIKPFWNYALLNTRSTAKNLRRLDVTII